jgi:hypothetical protein
MPTARRGKTTSHIGKHLVVAGKILGRGGKSGGRRSFALLMYYSVKIWGDDYFPIKTMLISMTL